MTRPVAIMGGLDELRQRVAARHHDYAIMLAGGAAISRKTIRLKTKRWEIANHIDGSRQRLTDEELWTESNIGEALDKHALLDMSGDPMLDIEGRGPVLASVLNAEAIGQAAAWREARAKERAENPRRFALSDAPGSMRLGEEGEEWEPANPSLVLEPCDIGPHTVASIDLAGTMLDFTNAKGEPQPNGYYLVAYPANKPLRAIAASIELGIEDIDDLIETLTAIRQDAIANRGFAKRADGFWTNGSE
jgi:hypothetical protein